MSDKENKNLESENQEHDLDSLLGGESEEIAEMLRNSETLSSVNKDDAGEADLDAFLDEPEDSAADPELDAALSQFVDEDGAPGDNAEEPRQEQQRDKLSAIKKIKRISLIGALAVLVIAVGLVAFFMIDDYSKSYVLTYEIEINGKNEKHSVKTEDFKFLIINSQSYEPVSDAVDFFTVILTTEKAARDRNLTLSAEEQSDVELNAKEFKNIIDDEFPLLNKVTIEFLERYLSASYLYNKISEGILDEIGFVLNEEDYAAELADYIENSKVDYVDAGYKYLLTETKAEAEEAKAAIESGELTADEALSRYFHENKFFAEYYGFESQEQMLEMVGAESVKEIVEEYGLDKTDLYTVVQEFGIYDDINSIIALGTDEVSGAIEISETLYLLLIMESVYIPSNEEIDEYFMDMYMNSHMSEAFGTEFQKWQQDVESGIKINQKGLDSIDVDALFEAFY